MSRTLDRLKKLHPFESLPEGVLDEVSSLVREEHVGEGQRIIREGDTPHALYVIESGRVEVRKSLGAGPGDYKTLAFFEGGEVFGEMGMFGKETRTADVLATKETVLWKLDYGELGALMKEDSAGAARILKVIITLLVGRMETLTREMVALYDLGRHLPSLEDLEGLTEYVFGLIRGSIPPATSGLLAIFEHFQDQFVVYQSTEDIREAALGEDDRPVRLMREHKAPLVIGEGEEPPPEGAEEARWHSYVAAPIIHDDELIGFVLLGSVDGSRTLTAGQMILLSTICSQVGARIAFLERRKEDALRERLDRRKRFFQP
jgi:CRP-like cAMP-binding protein